MKIFVLFYIKLQLLIILFSLEFVFVKTQGGREKNFCVLKFTLQAVRITYGKTCPLTQLRKRFEIGLKLEGKLFYNRNKLCCKVIHSNLWHAKRKLDIF